MVIVSACLAGRKCRYNGQHASDEAVIKMVEEGKAVTVCPEEMGGLKTPRIPCEILGGDGRDVLEGRAMVIDQTGRDQTKAFIKGAKAVLKAAESCGAKKAILKGISPSCGSTQIYCGKFNGEKKAGMGVTAALLTENGIIVREI